MDSFYATVERVSRKFKRETPIGVGGKNRKGIILSATYPAKRKGVKTGMLIHEAKRICPQIKIYPPDFKKYEEYSNRFMQILQKYSPHILKYSIDECFMDFRGCEKIWENPLQVAHKILTEIKEKTGLDASIGISKSMIYAKMLSKTAKPNGILFLYSPNEIQFFSSFPITKVPGIGKKTSNFLNSIGIVNIKGFTKLNPLLIRKYLGINGEKLYFSLKELKDSFVPYEKKHPKSMGKETTLPSDCKENERLKKIAYFFLQTICHKLRKMNLVAGKITVKVRYPDFNFSHITSNLERKTNHEELIREKLFEMVEKLNTHPMGVRKIGITLSELATSRTVPSLFDMGKIKKLDKLNYAVDKIRNLYGDKAILKGITIKK